MSSNPFAPDAPQTLNPWARDAVEQRYPSLGVSAPSPPQPQQQSYGMMHPQQQQQQQQPQAMMQYPQQQYQQQTGFQPSSAFGQQLATQVNSYAGVQDLDPYGSIPSSFSPSQPQSQQPQQQQQEQQQQQSSSGSTKDYGAHPRVLLDNSKAQLESWQPQAWAALLRRIDALQSAWSARRSAVLSALENQQGRILQPDEQHRFEEVLRDAEDKVDGLAAGRFQIEEVQSGYRHSTDAQSKARVRQALNDVVRAWPDWPEDLYTGPVGGQQQQQQQPQQHMQMQYTGMQQQQPQYGQQMGYRAAPQPQQQMYTGMPQSSMGMQQPQQMGMSQPQPQPMGMSMQPQPTGMMPQQQMGMPQQQQQYGMPQYGQMYGQQWGGM